MYVYDLVKPDWKYKTKHKDLLFVQSDLNIYNALKSV